MCVMIDYRELEQGYYLWVYPEGQKPSIAFGKVPDEVIRMVRWVDKGTHFVRRYLPC